MWLDLPISCWSLTETFRSGKTLKIAVLIFDGSSDGLIWQETKIKTAIFNVFPDLKEH